ncbi:MAG: glycoside hydrolase family 57 protein [Candidatus Caldatribacteriota bacterium]
MAKLIEENEKIKVTFNFTPCLVEQILDYMQNNIKDTFLDLSLKSPSLLSNDEKFILLERFFRVNWEKVVNKKPRYADLLIKRGYKFNRAEDAKLLNAFTEQDFLDLQTLFNLSWISKYALEEDGELKKIEEKGKNYSEQEKLLVLQKMQDIIQKTLPLYSKLYKEGRIEISTSPYAHPIMPLLINTDIARQCQDTPLPEPSFSWPEDLDEQIKWGKQIVEGYFGNSISGSWLPEGAISPEILPFLNKYNFDWCATDEDILYKSKKINHKEELYKPYFVEIQSKRITILFRDKTISDLIGFNYGKMKTSEAIKDLITKIKYIQNSLNTPGILPIILDGENPWEFYPEWGISFLRELYRSLGEEKDIALTTFKEAIDNLPAERLDTISTGSWIDGNFKIWIGEEEDNLSWDYLRKVRSDYEYFSEEEKRKVKQIILAAEGSDWNWWYGTKPLTTTNLEFDFIYRTHLMSIYALLNKKIPDYLLESIIKNEEKVIITLKPKWIIKPVIDGKCTDYFEWHNAASLKGEAGNGMMFIHKPIIDFINFGFDLEKIFFLIKFDKIINTFKEFKIKLSLRNKSNNFSLLFSYKDREFKLEEPLDFPVEWKFLEALEIGLPFLKAGFKKGEDILFNILFILNEKPISKIPGYGSCGFTLPDEEYTSKNWIV